MNAIQRIAKNIGWSLISQIISNILVFVYTIYMARYLGVTGFGILSFGLALISILSIFTDLGQNVLMTREIARDKSLVMKYLNNVFSIKLILVSIIFVSTVIAINVLNYPQNTVNVVYLLLLYLIFTTFNNTFSSVIQAYEKLEYSAIGLLLSTSLMLLGIFIAIYLKLSVVGFAFIYCIAALILLIYFFLLSSRKLVIPKIKIDWMFSKKIILLALQFGFIGVFSTLYLWVDSLILFSISGEEAVGYYNAAYRIVLVLLFLPAIINAAIFPVMSRLYKNSISYLKTIVEKYFKIMMLIGIPTGVFITILAKQIINLIFGSEFLPSTISLQILVWATIFTLANAAFVQLFQAINKQMVVTKITGLGLIINIILNLILIPKISFIGASIATLITELIVVSLLIIITNRTVYALRKNRTLIYTMKIITSSLIVGIFIYEFQYLNMFILISASLIIYLSLIALIKVIDKEDKEILREIF